MVDEAYIHFADGANSAVDLVKAGKDVIVLRTFSKIYGMAGLRCGFSVARPDLQEKVSRYHGFNPMPITAVVAASASLKDANLVPERKRINTATREQVFDWLRTNGYSFIPSQSNCFMLNTQRDGQHVIEALRQQNVYIGRIWPVMPTYVRITVGTPDEMGQFQTAFNRVMKNTSVGQDRHAGAKDQQDSRPAEQRVPVRIGKEEPLESTRRKFLAQSAGALGLLFLDSLTPQLVAQATQHAQSGDRCRRPRLQVPHPQEAADFDAFAAQIIPSTDGTPGAREAGVVYFADYVLTAINPEQQKDFRGALAALHAATLKAQPGPLHSQRYRPRSRSQ